MKDLQEVVDEVKGTENNISNVIVPILRDTINDTNKHNRRLFISNIILIMVVLILSIGSMILVTVQNQKYSDFLSQFEFETEVIQDTDDYSTINSGININH